MRNQNFTTRFQREGGREGGSKQERKEGERNVSVNHNANRYIRGTTRPRHTFGNRIIRRLGSERNYDGRLPCGAHIMQIFAIPRNVTHFYAAFFLTVIHIT